MVPKHAAMLQQAMTGGVSDGGLTGLRGIAKQALTDRALDLRVYAGKVRRGRARHEGAGDEGLKNKNENKGVSEKASTARSLEFAQIQHSTFIGG